MGFWKQVFDAFEKEYYLNGGHPVDKWEREKENRKNLERERRREERERAKELELQRKYVYLTLPERLKPLEHDHEKLKAAALRLTGENLDDYVGPDFSDFLYRINRDGGHIVSSHSSGGGGCGHTPSIKRDYDQEEAEAHEQYIDSVCTAIRVGRVLRAVEKAQFIAATHRH